MSRVEFFKNFKDALDPFQAYIDYLLEMGLAPGEAWDRVWAN